MLQRDFNISGEIIERLWIPIKVHVLQLFIDFSRNLLISDFFAELFDEQAVQKSTVSYLLIEILFSMLLNFNFSNFSNYRIFTKLFCKFSEHVIGVKWMVRGEENLNKSKSSIIVANHQSSLDSLGLSCKSIYSFLVHYYSTMMVNAHFALNIYIYF